MAAAPMGGLGDYFDAGGGGQFFGALPLDPAGRVRLRADFGFLVYGQEQQRFCFSVPIGCRIEMDLTTTNTVLYGGVGPEVVLATGAVEPYLNAGVGFSYFATMSSLSGENNLGDIEDNPDGSITVYPNRSEANLVAFRLGVTMGIPHRRSHER